MEYHEAAESLDNMDIMASQIAGDSIVCLTEPAGSYMQETLKVHITDTLRG